MKSRRIMGARAALRERRHEHFEIKVGRLDTSWQLLGGYNVSRPSSVVAEQEKSRKRLDERSS